MGRLFIPMFTTTTTPHHCHTRHPQRRQSGDHRLASIRGPSLFDVLMTGMLGPIHHEPTARTDREQTAGKQSRYSWVHGVNMKGFHPEEITVKVEEHLVYITAKHVDENEFGSDVIERHRKVPVPETVDAEKLTCFFAENGKLILKAPYITTNVTSCSRVHCTRGTAFNLSKDECCSKLSSETKPDSGNVENTSEKRSVNREVNEIPTVSNQTDKSEDRINEESTADKRPLDPVTLLNDAPHFHGKVAVQDGASLERQDEAVQDDPTSMADKEIEAICNFGDHLEKQQHEVNEDININDITNEKHFETTEDATIRPSSPHESVEFVFLDKELEEEPPSVEANQKDEDTTVQLKENLLDIKEMEKDDRSFPLMDSTRIIEDTDGNKQFEITVNLQHFKPEDTSIRWTNDTLQIDAEKNVKTDSMSAYQKVHREYSLPTDVAMEAAEAAMNDAGLFRVTVPLSNDS